MLNFNQYPYIIDINQYGHLRIIYGTDCLFILLLLLAKVAIEVLCLVLLQVPKDLGWVQTFCARAKMD